MLARPPRIALLPLLVAGSLLCSAGSHAADDHGLLDEARRIHAVGAAHFGAGRHAAAIRAFRAALELADRPSLHFNLACALEAGGQVADAVAEYRLYLETRPEAPDRADVEALIAWLEAGASPLELGRRAARPGPPVHLGGDLGAAPPLPPLVDLGPLSLPAVSASPVPGYLTLGGAALAALTAGWFGIQAVRADAEFDAARLRVDSSQERSRVSELAQTARRQALYADAAAAGAVVATALGTWLLLREPDSDPASPAGSAAGLSATATHP